MNLFDYIFTKRASQTDCSLGEMLIAQPFLQEFYFHRACVYIVEREKDKPSTGFVVNNKTNYMLKEIIEGVNPAIPDIPVFCGGPLSLDRLYYLHDLPSIPNSIHVANGICYDGDLEAIMDYINSGQPIDGHLKFFIGYSGWDNMQLLDEIRSCIWAIEGNADKQILEYDMDEFWDKSVCGLGARYRSWLLCPSSPSLN